MPKKPPTPCYYYGCAALTEQKYCEKHVHKVVKPEPKKYKDNRPSRSARGYDEHWMKLRRMVLAQEPLCRSCMTQGRHTAANEVDHMDGNVRNNAWSNMQSLCKSCHSKKTVRDRRGASKGL